MIDDYYKMALEMEAKTGKPTHIVFSPALRGWCMAETPYSLRGDIPVAVVRNGELTINHARLKAAQEADANRKNKTT